VKYSLDGAYDLLERTGLLLPDAASPCMRSPTRLPSQTSRANPPFCRRRARCDRSARRHGSRVWFMDEASSDSKAPSPMSGPAPARGPARCGKHGYEWVYLYTAVEPATGESAALVAPNVNTER